MIKTARSWMTGFLLASVIGGSLLAVALPARVDASTPNPKCPDTVLTFPTWYRKLQGPDCEIKSPSKFNSPGKQDGLSIFVWKIVLNVLEIALQIVGYLAVGFIIYGGFKYITGAGAPDKIVAGRKIILNAVIGLVISIFSIAIVNLAGRGF